MYHVYYSYPLSDMHLSLSLSLSMRGVLTDCSENFSFRLVLSTISGPTEYTDHLCV
eukprot:gene10294-7196_t